jgi:hypothetical protein
VDFTPDTVRFALLSPKEQAAEAAEAKRQAEEWKKKYQLSPEEKAAKEAERKSRREEWLKKELEGLQVAQ